MRITKTGFALIATYLLLAFVCVTWAQFIVDPKGKFVVLQIPVVLQHGLLLAADGTRLLDGASWPYVYLVLGLPMVLVLAVVGWVVELIASTLLNGPKAFFR